MLVRFLLLFLIGCFTADAHPRYLKEIPAIPTVDGMTWIGLGHFRYGGGARLNKFGQDFAGAGHKWTKELCSKDSDGDGFTNGQELGDPQCKWVKGMSPADTRAAVKLSHPGLASSTPIS